MTINRTSRFSLVFAVAYLACSQAATAALACQQPDGAGTGVSIAYSDTNEYSRFEFAPTGGGDQWIGIVFEFFGTAPTNALLQEVSPSARGKGLSEQVTRSFMTHLQEQMPYDAMSEIRFHEVNGRIVTTFDTVFGEHRDLRAIYSRWDGEDFQFFRAIVPVDDRHEHSEALALEAMRQMIRNCLNHET